MKKIFIFIFIAIFLMFNTLEAKVSITSHSYQKVIKKKNIKWVKATKVIPGNVLLYHNSLKNEDKTTATNLVIVNAIPKHMQYIEGSAKCKNKCRVRYSVDGGKTFHTSKKLFMGKGKKRHRAKASEYTSIKWIVNSLKGGKKTFVQYKAKLE